jgi:hypothetical protein
MKNRSTAVNSRIRNTAFAALLFTVLGYLLLEAGLFWWGARAGAHVISTIIGAALFGLAWRAAASRLPAGTADGLGTIESKKSRFITLPTCFLFFTDGHRLWRCRCTRRLLGDTDRTVFCLHLFMSMVAHSSLPD